MVLQMWPLFTPVVFRMHQPQPLATSLRIAKRKSRLCWLLAVVDMSFDGAERETREEQAATSSPTVFLECSFLAETTQLVMMVKKTGESLGCRQNEHMMTFSNTRETDIEESVCFK